MEKAPTHLWNLVNSTAKHFSKLEEAELGGFSAQPIDLDVISPELSRLGITKSKLGNQSPPRWSIVTNRAVVDFEAYRVLQGLPKSLTTHWLTGESSPAPNIQGAINSAVKAHAGLVKNRHRRPDLLETFLTSEFSLSGTKGKFNASNLQPSAVPPLLPVAPATEARKPKASPARKKAKGPGCQDCLALTTKTRH